MQREVIRRLRSALKSVLNGYWEQLWGHDSYPCSLPHSVALPRGRAGCWAPTSRDLAPLPWSLCELLEAKYWRDQHLQDSCGGSFLHATQKTGWKRFTAHNQDTKPCPPQLPGFGCFRHCWQVITPYFLLLSLSSFTSFRETLDGQQSVWLMSITSWGRDKCHAESLTLYTRISAYRHWISSVTNQSVRWTWTGAFQFFVFLHSKNAVVCTW